MARRTVPRSQMKLGPGFRPRRRSNFRSAYARSLCLVAATAMLFSGLLYPAHAQSNNVRITKLSDVNFGNLTNLEADAALSQSVCLFAHTSSKGYRITGTGSGAAGAFDLASAAGILSYEVQWNQAPGQSSGVQLYPNEPLSGQTTTATHQTCNNGPTTSASLIVLLRSAALSSAGAGSYTGTLTLIVGPE